MYKRWVRRTQEMIEGSMPGRGMSMHGGSEE